MQPPGQRARLRPDGASALHALVSTALRANRSVALGDITARCCAFQHPDAAVRVRSSPLSSDFEDVGLDETRGSSLALGAGYSGVLVDSGDDSPSSDSPELPVVSVG